MSEDDIIVSRSGPIGKILLNRPKALNSVTLGMVRIFRRALDTFGADDRTHAVLVSGAGERAFCAGGDIRALYDLRDGVREPFKTFWREEYELNARIASFPKRYVVFMDGLVMGGGVGLSAHGNRRIVTERTRLAMPETSIGFIPDIGATWLLSRSGGLGVYLALTGVAIEAADAIDAGLADMVSDSAHLHRLEQELQSTRRAADVDAILRDHCRPSGEGKLAPHRALLDKIATGGSVEKIIDALSSSDRAFARDAARIIAERSPMSVKLAFALLQAARSSDGLEACLENEFRVACRLLDTHDLYEGIRAAIIDKDRRPLWRPSRLADVDDGLIRDMLQGSGDQGPQFAPWAAAPCPRWKGCDHESAG